MSKSLKTESEKLSLELEKIRSIAQERGHRQKDPLFNTQLTFWMESVRFCITELEIWDKEGDTERCNQIIHRARECLDRLHQLID